MMDAVIYRVFPAEACEIVEGDACAAVMYPDSWG